MRPRTKELLYLMLWTFETLSRPSFRNLGESFEGWAYRRGFLGRLHELEAMKFIERRDSGLQRLFRLTESGRLLALGGVDPDLRWNRRWDGKWRLVVFDVPNRETRLRNQLRNQLRSAGYGWLQNSVWISPDRLKLDRSFLKSTKIDVELLMLWEASPVAGESNSDIVRGAWNFERIDDLYREHDEILNQLSRASSLNPADARRLLEWKRTEQAAWEAATNEDPMLPSVLLPPGYRGRKAWARRQHVLGKLGEYLHHSPLKS